MNRDEMLLIARGYSDHRDRVDRELEPAIIDSLKNTPAHLPVLEIGNRTGGSCVLLMWHAAGRLVLTCDADSCAPLIEKTARLLGLQHEHYQMAQKDFVNKEAWRFTFGFVYFDADHNEQTVVEDMRTIAPYLAKGCILAVDDVDTFKALPEIEGMEMVDFHVDEGTGFTVQPHGHHFMCWRKL